MKFHKAQIPQRDGRRNPSSKDRRDSFTSNETHEYIEFYQSSPQSSPFSSTLRLESRPSTYLLHLQFTHLSVEDLSQYMITSQSGQRSQVPSSDIHTEERTLWPPSEALRFGLLSSSASGQTLRSAQQASNPPESP